MAPSTQDPLSVQPLCVRAPRGATTFEIDWADGVGGRVDNALLRGYCPCAGCQGHTGEIRFIPGQDSAMAEIEEVGSYALQFTWGDGHASGIYTFRYLRALCDYAVWREGHPEAAPRVMPRSLT